MAGNTTLGSGIAGRYAGALFELAESAKSIDAVEKDLNGLAAAIEESADLQRVIRSPVFSSEDQAGAMATIAGKLGLSPLTTKFIGLAARNRRLFALPDMIRAFRAQAAAARGEVSADVVSAHPLTDAQMKDLKASIKAAIGKDVAVNTSVDESLLGGLIVKVGSRMIDSSLKTKLNSLKIAMKEVG